MKGIILAVALAMVGTAPAMAATTSAARSNSGAAAQSASGSFAASGSSSASVTQIYNMGPSDPSDPSSDPSDPPADPSGDPTLNNNVHYSGGYKVNNVPEVIPPSWGGQNVCAVGASGGVGVAGFGITLGGMWSDTGCERRNSAVVLYQMGEHKAAVALMCQDTHVAEAMAAAGQPCPTEPVRVSRAAPPKAPAAPRLAGGHRLAAADPVPAAAPACHLVFHYPTYPDGRSNPNGAGWMEKKCG